ncbi:RHS repeat-associated core domain-containing protein [Fangia hongkongensis]|uniref:RHS repeat-associated core domain-containing protein n=1 Tax=Fangia hongkongensis TaxID=270495 RepID=UPI000369CAB0|nr:RHS repeat-associated core domain-containing protein [Fangia hongkongensis]MBK2124378.1 hypothetical protein [Fangia hongkongensis]
MGNKKLWCALALCLFSILLSNVFAADQGYEGSLTLLKDPFSYDNQNRDSESQTLYLRARNLDVQSRQFISQDSYKLFNRYSPFSADPVDNIDPSGHKAKTLRRIARGISAVAAAGVNFLTNSTTWGAVSVNAKWHFRATDNILGAKTLVSHSRLFLKNLNPFNFMGAHLRFSDMVFSYATAIFTAATYFHTAMSIITPYLGVLGPSTPFNGDDAPKTTFRYMRDKYFSLEGESQLKETFNNPDVVFSIHLRAIEYSMSRSAPMWSMTNSFISSYFFSSDQGHTNETYLALLNRQARTNDVLFLNKMRDYGLLAERFDRYTRLESSLAYRVPKLLFAGARYFGTISATDSLSSRH